jgi:glycosyltransferase involved in cell wall biosynthesis
MNPKKQILTFTAFYLPGYMGGGPIRTIASMVDILGDEFDFRIVALDRDLGSDEPYPGIKVSEWQQVGKAQVMYVSPGTLTFTFLRHLVNSTPHDLLYLNSFFSTRDAIMPLLLRRFGLINRTATIVAPRGEFSKGALNLKYYKKKIYLLVAKMVGIYRNITWQASSLHEKEDILDIFNQERMNEDASSIAIAPDLSQPCQIAEGFKRESKNPGVLKAVFLSRISPKKNLEGALVMLRGVKGEVIFDIYGPIEDIPYWEKCQNIIKTLPPTVHVQYKGIISHDQVAEVFQNQDLFFFPTLGENFGHVIIEALVAGCPILISDQTPWRNLTSDGVGWDVPLEQPEKFVDILQQCIDMDNVSMQQLSARAMEYGIQKTMDAEVVRQNRELFII